LAVWLTVGGSIALAVGLFAFGPWVFRFGVLFYPRIAARISDDSVLPTQTAQFDHAVRPVDRGGRALESASPKSAGVAAGLKRQKAASVMDSEVPANSEADRALFTALERLERRVATAIARARESVVTLEYTAADALPGTRRVATGVVINPGGEVLSVRIDTPPTSPLPTAGRRSALIVARDFSGRCYSVHRVAADPETGLTLLRLPPRAVRPIRAASDGLNLGSQVFVVGNSFGMGHSVSRGHVACLDRALELGGQQITGLIQVQVPLYPGDSGAAVINLHGDWLGVIRSGLAIPGSARAASAASLPLPGSRSSTGLASSFAAMEVSMGRTEHDNDFGFAISTRDALWVADQLRARGRVDRAYLGVRLESTSPTGLNALSELGPQLELTSDCVSPDGVPALAEEGAVLQDVLAGTPAAVAGLRAGDSITALDGQPIASARDLVDRLAHIPALTTIQLGVVRGHGPRKKRILISLRTASRPEAPRYSGIRSAVVLKTAFSSAGASLELNPELQARGPVVSPAPQPDELQFTLPRAIVDRLEKLERRLEKLESFPAHAMAPTPPADRQINSARNP